MPANALSEINLNVKPKYVGLSETLLNIVGTYQLYNIKKNHLI